MLVFEGGIVKVVRFRSIHDRKEEERNGNPSERND